MLKGEQVSILLWNVEVCGNKARLKIIGGFIVKENEKREVDISEDKKDAFVEALVSFGMKRENIKEIPEGCYTPKKEYNEVWIVK